MPVATVLTHPRSPAGCARLREAMSFSLRGLAQRSGVSAQMLSQVERAETSPTLAVAARTAHRLDVSLSQLLRPDKGTAVVKRSERPRSGPTPKSHSYEVLTPALPAQRAEVTEHTLAPARATGGADDPPMHEPGSHETATVTPGRLRLVCDGLTHELNERDAVTFHADLPHHFENPGDPDARFLTAAAAGLRRS